jgi:hypothetical protein
MVGFAFMQIVNTAMAIPITGWKMGISPKLTVLSGIPIALGVRPPVRLQRMFTPAANQVEPEHQRSR